MKYFLIGDKVHAYKADGSQDHVIPAGAQPVTQEFVRQRNARTPTLEAQRAAVWQRVIAKSAAVTSGGVKVGDYWYHTDTTSKIQHLGNKDTARDQLAAGGHMSDPLLDPLTGKPMWWKTMSGQFVSMTVQIAFDVVSAAKALELSAFAAAEAHRAAIRQASDPADYDFSQGWPVVYGGV